MTLALGTAAILFIALLSVLVMPRLLRLLAPTPGGMLACRRSPRPAPVEDYDPGRELRAEQRARALLRSCVNGEEWAMYRDLGFLRVRGALGKRPYAYLVYPHKPILAYDYGTDLMLGEYCVEFPDHTRPYGSTRLPDADDVLAKWVALTTKERALIELANMHLPGRQIRVAKARRDLARLECWERERQRSRGVAPLRVSSVPTL